MAAFYKLSIKEIKKETAEAVSIVFNIPETLQEFYQFIAGQYVTLKLTLDGQEIRRAYSICSSPKSGELRIAVKAIKNGFFSTFANEKLAVGQVLEVGTPEGKFIFEPKAERQRNYAAFVAGSGITPVFSIAKTVLEEEPNSSFVLVYGNKSEQDTIFHDQLHELQLHYVGRFFVQYVYSQANTNSALFGRIDKAAVNFVLKNKHSGLEFSNYYLCGPEEMIQTVTTVLKENNVSDSAIKYELFAAAASSSESTASNGHTKLEIVVDGETFTLEMSQKQTLLDAALKQGVDVPYSCQGGICSSCICKITEGSAELKKNQILSDEELADGLTLACQAYPTSEVLKIDFDQV